MKHHARALMSPPPTVNQKHGTLAHTQRRHGYRRRRLSNLMDILEEIGFFIRGEDGGAKEAPLVVLQNICREQHYSRVERQINHPRLSFR